MNTLFKSIVFDTSLAQSTDFFYVHITKPNINNELHKFLSRPLPSHDTRSQGARSSTSNVVTVETEEVLWLFLGHPRHMQTTHHQPIDITTAKYRHKQAAFISKLHVQTVVKTTPHLLTKTWLLPSTVGALAARLIKMSIAQFEHGEHSLGMFIRPHRWRDIQPFVLVSSKSTTVPWLSSRVWCNLNRAHVEWISCKRTYLPYVRRNHLSQVMWQECFHCSNEWFIGTFKLRVLWKQSILKTSQKNTVQFKISCIKCYATCLKVVFFSWIPVLSFCLSVSPSSFLP